MPPPPYSPDALRRRPDVEGPDLLASDAADRLILDESAAARDTAADGMIVVIGDEYGALTLGAADAGATGIRVHQDSLAGERALAANAEAAELGGAFRSLPLDATLVAGATVILVRLPRALDALDDIAGLIAAHADPGVTVFAGGRIKHMTLAMNEVLRRRFATVDVSHARQKSRVLIARGPHDGADPRPRTALHAAPGLDAPITICALGGAFAGTGIDIGTRFLLDQLATAGADELDGRSGDVIDLACGTGVIATWLALRQPALHVLASDRSAAAVTSAQATVAANGVAERVRVVRALGLESRPDASARLIALNPPFHAGTAVPMTGVADPLFADAGRVLAPGGELWAVWNSSLQYRAALDRLVGPTRQIARNAKFTVTVSTRR
ncbi:16S rRNA (guanine1207-N2)-methyltransferase [Microbacterium sp. cf046]|uniref:class I SAM-dependent methyltransferase n=1 Tax=Microbacterium sp. cf046 TaxID=1761803 RepID=UPI0008F42174|nr:methyltransferase [Microbacterium sp. cf046]SFS09212.1 16S rRNA (guanine1207-N2)-methyltransferase [Microbacterium sp. cf046]